LKSIGKTVIPLFLMVVILTSCNSSISTPAMAPTTVMETAMSTVRTALAETQLAIPTATLTPTPLPTPSPLPSIPPAIQATSLPVSMIPTTVVMENGLEWTECVVPNRDYAYSKVDLEFLKECVDIPRWDENDKKRMGERVESQGGLADLRITIGSDLFETKLDDITKKGCCSYQLVKNGNVILEITPGFMTSDPNRNFWNIGGELVWELAGYTTVIVVDGVDFNEKYQLEGSFFPYEINGKLIYLAKKDGKYHIVYDGEVVGPEFDQISMAYCCGMISVYNGHGQYWFVGRREGTKYIVQIH
jgi:hypothetical protein